MLLGTRYSVGAHKLGEYIRDGINVALHRGRNWRGIIFIEIEICEVVNTLWMKNLGIGALAELEAFKPWLHIDCHILFLFFHSFFFE